jgi:hypothetical protein
MTRHNAAERLVEAWLREQDLDPRKIAESTARTADYEVWKGEAREFFLEVMSLNETREGAGPSWRLNRLQKCIHKARKQLDAVNPDLAFPNATALVSRDVSIDELDLEEAVFGGQRWGDRFVPTQNIRHRALLQVWRDVQRIHLIVWFNRDEDRARWRWMGSRGDPLLGRIAALFGRDLDAAGWVDPLKLRRG